MSDHDDISQLYLDDAISDLVFACVPYADNRQRRVRNQGDGIYRQGGTEPTVAPEPRGQGYSARFDIGLTIA